AAEQSVIARPAVDHVLALAPEQLVVPVVTPDLVVARPTRDPVVALAAVQLVVAAVVQFQVAGCVAPEGLRRDFAIVVAVAVDLVVAIIAEDDVVAATAADQVVAA